LGWLPTTRLIEQLPYQDSTFCDHRANADSGKALCEKRITIHAKGGTTIMSQSLITISLILAAMFPALAQTAAAPDFSGTWVFNSAKSTLAKDNTIKAETIVIDYKKSAIVFHYKTDGKKSTETYTPDGQKRVTKNMSSGQLTSKASWHDSVLVIESTLDIKVPNATVVVTGLKPVIDTWTLAADGRTLAHDADDHKEILVYDKQ
jgi:hypothetical protein